MTRRKQSKYHVLPFPWQHLYTGLLLLTLSGSVHMIPKPVADTKGTDFLFSAALCQTNSFVEIFIVPQTTKTVNVTLVSLDNSVYTIPPGGTLRHRLSCIELDWGDISNTGIYLITTHEVSLFVEYPGQSHVIFPQDTLGTEYDVLTPLMPNMDEAFVVITGSNSSIEIQLPDSLDSDVLFRNEVYTGAAKLNFELKDFETAAMSCKCDLTGAKIISSSPVNVLVGCRSNKTQSFVVDQLPSNSIWGRRFIWPSHPWIAQNVTLKITARNLPTYISVTLRETVESFTLSNTLTLVMQQQVIDFVSIETNSSVLCAILYDILDTSGSRHVIFRLLTPLLLYHVSSSFAFPENDAVEMSANMILSARSFPHITIDQTSGEEFTKKPMVFFWNYYICKAVPIRGVFQTSDSNTVAFHSNVFRRNSSVAYDYPLGMRVTPIYDKCVRVSRAHGGNGDGVDNDCDNKIDEEQLNGKDDDGDHSVDEDIWYSGVIKPDPANSAWEYILKHKEPDTSVSTSVIAVVISISVAVISVGCFIGGMLLADKIRQKISASRVNPLINSR